MEPPKETPCVSKSPDGVELTDINTAALVASNMIASKNDEEVEWGVFIYELDGRIHFTPPFGGVSGETINWNLGLPLLPDGAHILATVHNHPDVNGIDDRIPSFSNIITGQEGSDWQSYDSIRNADIPRGITADTKMLMYIYTNEKHATYVYDKDDRNTTHPICTLQEPDP